MNRKNSELPEVGLYIHVPFCHSKCSYCGFYSTLPDQSRIDNYLLHLENEAELHLKNHAGYIKTIFVGGGNPLCLGMNGLVKLVELLGRYIELDGIEEFTFEANPENLNEEIAGFLAKLPNIRLSLGVQRLRDEELKILGRRARMKNVMTACSLCSQYFANFSIDLILGVPGCNSLAPDLARFLEKFAIGHVSAYFLSIEPGSEMAAAIACGRYPDPQDQGPEEMFEVKQILVGKGFEHYEISNYAKPEKRCRHNMNYWKQKDYIGLGPSAVSTEGSLRRQNPADLELWLHNQPANCEELTATDRRNEYLMLRMRLISDGLNLNSFEKKFEKQNSSCYTEIDRQIDLGNLERSAGIIKLTDKGIAFADLVIAGLFV
jgi:oxygen-independent coproporphyrinogen-3 oxidase